MSDLHIPEDGKEDTCSCGEGIHYDAELGDWQHDHITTCDEPYPAGLVE